MTGSQQSRPMSSLRRLRAQASSRMQLRQAAQSSSRQRKRAAMLGSRRMVVPTVPRVEPQMTAAQAQGLVRLSQVTHRRSRHLPWSALRVHRSSRNRSSSNGRECRNQ